MTSIQSILKLFKILEIHIGIKEINFLKNF
jgi:hypothetical protein